MRQTGLRSAMRSASSTPLFARINSYPQFGRRIIDCKRWRPNPSGKLSRERLPRGTVTSTMRRAAHPSGYARCSAGAGWSAMKYQSLYPRLGENPAVPHSGLGKSFQPMLFQKPVTLSVRTFLCSYGVAFRRAYGLTTSGYSKPP